MGLDIASFKRFFAESWDDIRTTRPSCDDPSQWLPTSSEWSFCVLLIQDDDTGYDESDDPPDRWLEGDDVDETDSDDADDTDDGRCDDRRFVMLWKNLSHDPYSDETTDDDRDKSHDHLHATSILICVVYGEIIQYTEVIVVCKILLLWYNIPMTLFDLIRDPQFRHKYVFQKIVCHLTGWERDTLIARYDEEISSELYDETLRLYNLYAIDHEPLEYILWYVEYGGLRFAVNRHTIIPRPETEYMIEAVRTFLTPVPSPYSAALHWQDEGWPQDTLKKYILVDVGTGSGVLGLSILHSHGSQIDTAFLIDISEDALAVAKGNYERLVAEEKIDVEIEVVLEKGNLLSSPALDNYRHSERFLPSQEWQPQMMQSSQAWQGIVIVANLPYIPDETFDTNPDLSIKYEPRVAFVGGDDGLDLYRVMFGQLVRWRDREIEDGRDHASSIIHHWSITMFLEMMTWQVDILRKEFEWLEFEEIATFHFQIRIVRVQISEDWSQKIRRLVSVGENG